MKTINRRKFIKVAGSAALMTSAPAIATSGNQYDVIVIGAGLSGLHAAMLLQENGYKVLVLEGRKRLGGRVYTLMDVPGKPEAAGEWIGANYARMISTAKKLGMELYVPEANSSGSTGWAYNIKGQFFSADDWESHKLNPLKGEDRKILPHKMLQTITNQNNPLTGKPLDAWLTPEFAQYDIPFDQYLRARGLDEETIRLMGVTIHTSNLRNTSALHELRRYHVNEFNANMQFADGGSYKMIKGGNSLLPEAMANSLDTAPILGKTVVHFEQTASSVRVDCSDGTSYTAANVVCSIPLSVMRHITFAPQIPVHMNDIIDEVDYGISLQAHFLIHKPYWEEDGMSASMWTDGPLERFGARNVGGQGQPAGVAFINGDESERFRLMPDEDVFAYVEQKLVELRPSMKGALEPLMIQSCERDPHGAGDWVYWQPGQVRKYANDMRQKHGRIHFCGEHTAIMERGMEGAFESGERAALDIILS